MNEDEVIKELGITQKSLQKYKEAGLIRLVKNEDKSCIYNHEDLRLLRIIMQLQNYHLSVQEIQYILEKQMSLSDFCNDNVIKERDIAKIEKNILRRKAAFEFQVVEEQNTYENYICFKNNNILINDPYDIKEKIIEISYADIVELEFSICTRAYSWHLDVDEINSYDNPQIGLTNAYYIDLDLYIKDKKFEFESISLKNIYSIIKLLKEKNINIIDKLGLIDFFIENRDKDKFYSNLKNKVRQWSKEFDIDNPRSIEVINQSKQIKQKIINDKEPKNDKIKFTKKGILIPERIRIPDWMIVLYFLFIVMLCIWGYLENYG